MQFSHRRARRQASTTLDADALRLNLSFVLHERADSVGVQRAASACMAFAAWSASASEGLTPPRTTLGDPLMPVDRWLTPSVGMTQLLRVALTELRGAAPELLQIDEIGSAPEVVEFFRAPARLALPGNEQCRVGVAALVVRPGRSSSQLDVAGPFAWPQESAATLRALERCIHDYVDQWLPRRALWDSPAELLLADEVR